MCSVGSATSRPGRCSRSIPKCPRPWKLVIERLHAKDPRCDTSRPPRSPMCSAGSSPFSSGRAPVRSDAHPMRQSARREGATGDQESGARRRMGVRQATPSHPKARRGEPARPARPGRGRHVLLGWRLGRKCLISPLTMPPAAVRIPGGSDDPRRSMGGQPANAIITSQDDHPTIVGSGKPATKAWNLADFKAVEIRHPFRADLTRADRFAVSVTADDNVLDHIQVEKKGSRLADRSRGQSNLPPAPGLAQGGDLHAGPGSAHADSRRPRNDPRV